MTHRFKIISSLTAALMLSSFGLSQPNDPTVQSNIDADNIRIDSKTGAMHLTGNVEMRHGAFLIKADSLVTYKKNNLLERAVAQGSPSTFEQFAQSGVEPFSAAGDEIEFLDTATEQSVKIKGNALLKQAGITAVCNQITFILENGVVQNMDGSSGESQCQVYSNGQPTPAPN
jgi:lipopolysaccharide export system protein LptA